MITTRTLTIATTAMLAGLWMHGCGGTVDVVGAATATDGCDQTVEAYCANHPCLAKVPPGSEADPEWRIVDAYCADQNLSKCITGVAICGAPDGGGPAYIWIELYGCDPPLEAFHQPSSGELVALSSVRGSGCIAGIRIGDLRCMGVGIHCTVSDAGKNTDADVQADESIDGGPDGM
jgi:hypothetical protein